MTVFLQSQLLSRAREMPTMQLLIDTSVARKITVALVTRGFRVERRTKIVTPRGAEAVVSAIAQLLRSGRGQRRRVRGIVVVTGLGHRGEAGTRTIERPAGFTHLRSGIITANALGYAWSIPVVGIAQADAATLLQASWRLTRRGVPYRQLPTVLPQYGHPPHITKSKSTEKSVSVHKTEEQSFPLLHEEGRGEVIGNT